MAGRWTKGLGERGIPALVHDHLETHYGDWHTMTELVGVVQRYRPDAKPNTIRRSVLRLHERGMIESAWAPDRDNTRLYRLVERAYHAEADEEVA